MKLVHLGLLFVPVRELTGIQDTNRPFASSDYVVGKCHAGEQTFSVDG